MPAKLRHMRYRVHATVYFLPGRRVEPLDTWRGAHHKDTLDLQRIQAGFVQGFLRGIQAPAE